MKENNITKGFEVLKSEFFTKCFYMILDANLFNEEHKISILFGFPDYRLDIFTEDFNDIRMIFENYNNFKQLICDDYDLKYSIVIDNSQEQQIVNDSIIHILTIDYSQFSKNKILEIYSVSDGKINIDGKECSTKSFEILLNKIENGFNFQPIISEIKIEFSYDNQEFIKNLPYINLEKIKLEGNQLDLSLLKNCHLKNLKELDLSEANIFDIKEICGEVPFTNLEVLNLSKNSISNLYELKNSKFTKLRKLNLSQCNIESLEKIELKDYPFKNLVYLNLGKNKINELDFLEDYIPFPEIVDIILEGNYIPSVKIDSLRRKINSKN
jgi:hypothetical protein